jgi:hypothetical protein
VIPKAREEVRTLDIQLGNLNFSTAEKLKKILNFQAFYPVESVSPGFLSFFSNSEPDSARATGRMAKFQIDDGLNFDVTCALRFEISGFNWVLPRPMSTVGFAERVKAKAWPNEQAHPVKTQIQIFLHPDWQTIDMRPGFNGEIRTIYQ